MLVLLFVSVLISYRISSKHYQRIYQLKESMRNVLPEDGAVEQCRRENDFDTMHSMIRSISTETNRMKVETENVRAILKQQAAMLLFYGGIREERSIVGMLESCGMELQEPYFTVACIVTLEEGHSLLPSMESLLRENLACISRVEDRQALIVLFELANEDFLKKQRDLLAQKLQQLAGEEHPLKIGFSQTYESLLRAPGAYLEATGISQNILHTEKQAVGYIDTVIGANEQNARFPDGVMERFEGAVMRGELQSALNSLDVVLTYIRKSDFPEENKQYLRYNLVQNMLLCLQNQEEYQDGEVLEELAGIDVVDEVAFERRIRESLGQMCRQEEKERKVHFSKIVEYINANYHRYDLSLENVAEYAGISKVYLSRIFKEKTGSKYIEYLTRCRMEHAKNLLEETDIGIKEIASMVGYLNVPSFRNKFKEYYGVNASEYRKKRQEANSEPLR